MTSQEAVGSPYAVLLSLRIQAGTVSHFFMLWNYAVSTKQIERSSKVVVPELGGGAGNTLTLSIEKRCGVLEEWR